jgi:hypothetical protein
MSEMAKVSSNLREIERLAGELRAQAVADGRSRVMPGGRAMIALAPVASLEAWENLTQATERAELTGIGKAYTSTEDEDPEKSWPPFQMLVFWSEAWRRETGTEYDDPSWKPTIQTEAAFLRHALEWAWDNEVGWDSFVKDVETAKTKLEDILSEGERAVRGAPCLYDECKGKRLVRKFERKRDENGAKVWEWGKWHCPRCHRQWDADQYARMVTAATEAVKVEQVGDEVWCTVEHAAKETGRSARTIRTWLSRGQIATLCIRAGRRKPYVLLEEVKTRHEEALTRKRAG